MNGSLGHWIGIAIVAAAGCGGAGANVSAGPMPRGGSYTGVWFSPQYGEMHMLQQGNSVVGRYVKDERSGRLHGTASGDVLRFEWTESREMVMGRPSVTTGRGYFQYRIGEDGKHNLIGGWGIDENESGGGQWNAYRMAGRSPVIEATGSREDDDSGDSFDDPGASSGGDDFDEGPRPGRVEDEGDDDGLDGLF